MLSISTCWNSARHNDGSAMIGELTALGFGQVELGHGIRVSLWERVESAFRRGKMRVSSLHNFCPLPVGISGASPDCFQFSSYKAAERERAVRQTLNTIEFAQRVEARLIVLHCGRVVMGPVTSRLIDLAKTGKHLSAEYARLKTQAVAQREALSPKYMARLKSCLEPIVEAAAKAGIRLGLESRQFYEEMPSEREFAELMDAFPAETVGYWHDFGHVQTRANLGFVDHAQWLAKMAPRLIGCHVHDVEWPARDHRVPFLGGSVEYEKLLPLLPPGTPLVWELSPRSTAEEIRQSLRLWQERFPAFY